MSDRYEIRVLGDFLKVPPEKLAACMADFYTWSRVALHAKEIGEAASNLIGTPHSATFSTDVFIWVDDGVPGISGMQLSCNGEVVAEVPL